YCVRWMAIVEKGDQGVSAPIDIEPVILCRTHPEIGYPQAFGSPLPYTVFVQPLQKYVIAEGRITVWIVIEPADVTAAIRRCSNLRLNLVILLFGDCQINHWIRTPLSKGDGRRDKGADCESEKRFCHRSIAAKRENEATSSCESD